jgi:hypothetical protein
MRVSDLQTDPLTSMPIVVLSDGDISVALRIALCDANAISTALRGVELTRPTTHQLLCRLIESTGHQLSRIEIVDVQDDVHYARIVLTGPDGTERFEEARCSDAIAAAMFSGAEIWVARWVVDTSRVRDRTPLH